MMQPGRSVKCANTKTSVMKAFDEAALQAVLQVLPRLHRLAFIASCAERVLPFYEAFARQDGIQEHYILRRALDVVWNAVVGMGISQRRYDEIESSLRAAAPDPEREYRSPFVPNASDALDIMHSAYAVLIGREDDESSVQHAVDAGISARTTIDLYLGLATLPECMPIVMADYQKLGQIDFTATPMFLAEVQKQEEDLALLRSASTVDDEVVLSIRTRGFIGVQPVTRFSL